MARSTTTWSITVPKPLAKEVNHFIARQKRSKSELISEALRQYLVLWAKRTPHLRAQKPSKVPKGQAWFWTPEWQEKEREADSAIRKGKVSGPFHTVEELLKHLNRSGA